jgi:glycosyltransferase involved in cell wall biosynthesis
VKRLLVLAYFFPPIGGGGCQRTLKLVRYLKPLGWDSTVVTARDSDYWILDPTLLEEVPDSTEVIRAGGLTSHRLVRLLSGRGVAVERRQEARDPRSFRRLRRLQSWLLIPDGYLRWAREAERAAAQRIGAGGVDVIWTTSSPESAHLAGLGLKRRFGLPWVADFRDPWVGRVTYNPPTPWHDARHRSLERDVVMGADRVTVVSDAMASLYRGRYPDLPRERFVTIPNGVDSDDWVRADRLASAAASSEEADRDQGRLILLHAGQLAHRPTVRTLLAAARRVLDSDPSAASALRLRFLGGNEELLPEECTDPALKGIVELHPSRPHIEALAAMRRADALVLLGHGGEADSLLYTGKIYEYLTSGRPVLGIVDPGPGADLLAASNAGPVCSAGDIEAVAAAIRSWISEWRRGGSLTGGYRNPGDSPWERRAVAAQVASLLGGLLGRPNFVSRK